MGQVGQTQPQMPTGWPPALPAWMGGGHSAVHRAAPCVTGQLSTLFAAAGAGGPRLCFGRPVAPTPPVTSPSPSSSLPVRLRLSTGEVIWGECPHLSKCQSHPFHLFTKYGLRPFAVYQGQSSCWGPKCGAPCPSTQRVGTCSHVPSTQEVLRGFGLSRWDRSSGPNLGVPHKQREVKGECSALEEGAAGGRGGGQRGCRGCVGQLQILPNPTFLLP